jgi:hypothetical protein
MSRSFEKQRENGKEIDEKSRHNRFARPKKRAVLKMLKRTKRQLTDFAGAYDFACKSCPIVTAAQRNGTAFKRQDVRPRCFQPL